MICSKQARPLRDLDLRLEPRLVLDIRLDLLGPPAAIECEAPHGAQDDARDEPHDGDDDEVVDEDAQRPATRRDTILNDAVVAGADGAAAQGLEAGPSGARDVGFLGAKLVLAVVGVGVVFVAPVATVVEPGGRGVGGQRSGREGIGLRVREGADGEVGTGCCGCVVIVRVYVKERIPEGAFVGLVPEDAEGEDVVLDPRRWVHSMGARCRVYYRLEILLVNKLVGSFWEVLPVSHTSPQHDK